MKPMSAQDRLRRVTSIDDLRALAERNVPRAFFQYTDHGSYSQSTLDANRRDLQSIGLRQRVAIDVDTEAFKRQSSARR
jgi:L-lactate dehydrogenase (cytochrome)